MARKKKGQRADGLVEVKRKMADGSYKHFYGANKAECEAKYREALIAAAQAAEEQAAGPMFSELADQWWLSHRDSLSPNTALHYQRMLPHIIDAFGKYRAADITPSIITAWLEGFARAGKARKTAANYKIVLSDILQFGYERYDLPPNPARSIALPRGMAKSKRKMPTDDQLKIILDNYQTDWACEVYYILAFTGLRCGELLALQWQDLDAEKGCISITKSLYWENDIVPKLKSPKTEAGSRVIPYLPQVQAILEPKRALPKHYVFHGQQQPNGASPMTRKGYTSLLAHAKKLGVVSTPHSLRHAFTTLCYESGIDSRTVGAIFGWEDPGRMENIYAEIRKTQMQNAGNILANAEYLKSKS